jgi:hypothetical protein
VIIPPERVSYIADADNHPKAGDIVELDQGYTGPNGESMGIVSCRNDNGSIRWSGDVMDTEIELLA